MGSQLWINPLMPIYWAFELHAVAARNLYIDLLHGTDTITDVALRIAAYRSSIANRHWQDIPV